MSSTTRGSKKLSRDASEEEFETYVRELLTRLCECQNKIIQDISSVRGKVQSNEAALVKLSKQCTTLNQSFEELKGELHDARCKVDEIESSVQNHTTQMAQMNPYLTYGCVLWVIITRLHCHNCLDYKTKLLE